MTDPYDEPTLAERIEATRQEVDAVVDIEDYAHGGSPHEPFDPDQLIGPDDVLIGVVDLDPLAAAPGTDADVYRVVAADGSIYREIRVPQGLEMSDGHHTFDELYDHRRKLTAVLATIGAINGDSWRSKQHHPEDGPMFDGSFIVGIELPAGPISYHYPLDSWDEFAAVPVLEHAPKWDGAGPAETLVRLADFTAHLKQAIDDGRVVEQAARDAADAVAGAADEPAGGSTLNAAEQD